MPSRYLICTADDFGYSAKRDVGIIKCFVEGIVTRASLLVNGVHAAPGVTLAQEASLPLGLHLNLTEGTPCSSFPNSLAPSERSFRGKFATIDALESGKVERKDVQAEVVAQVDKFRRLTGSLPSYIDGHNHVHVFPLVAEVLSEVMQEYCLGEVRIPSRSPRLLPSHPLSEESETFLLRVESLASQARHLYAQRGVRSSEAFIGLWLGGDNLSKQNVFKSLCSTSDHETTVELMVHPGFLPSVGESAGCGVGPDTFSCDAGRLHELETLCDPSLKELLCKDLGMRLTGHVTNHQEKYVVYTRTALIISSLTPATGNTTTALRLRRILNNFGFAVRQIDATSIPRDNHLGECIKKWNPEVCFGIHAVKGGSLVRFARQLNPQSKGVIVIGGTDVNCESNASLSLENLAAANLVVCFTPSLKAKVEMLLSTPGVESPLVRVIPQSVYVGSVPSVDLRRHLGFDETDKIFILPTGLRPVKDPLYLKDSFLRLSRQNASLKLLIIGPKLDVKVSHMVQAASCCSDEVIKYLQPVHRQLLLAFIRDADVLLNTSKSEGMASTVLEAMALKTLVVARWNEGNSSVIKHKENGLLFKDPQGFEELVLDFVLSGDKPRKEMIQQALLDFQGKYGFATEESSYQSALEILCEENSNRSFKGAISFQ